MLKFSVTYLMMVITKNSMLFQCSFTFLQKNAFLFGINTCVLTNSCNLYYTWQFRSILVKYNKILDFWSYMSVKPKIQYLKSATLHFNKIFPCNISCNQDIPKPISLIFRNLSLSTWWAESGLYIVSMIYLNPKAVWENPVTFSCENGSLGVANEQEP